MTGIVGSGFGLYGYLPAVICHEPTVCLLQRAKETFAGRRELAPFADVIVWKEDIDSFLRSIDTLIISIPPAEQARLLEKLVDYPAIHRLILEKPLAVSPADSLNALRQLQQRSLNFRISYSFLELNWYKQLDNLVKVRIQPTIVQVTWSFKAHHYKNDLHNWKRCHSRGGGVIRFFGIHLVAVASMLGFSFADTSSASWMGPDDVYRWNFSSQDEHGNLLSADIDSNSEDEQFKISAVGPAGEEKMLVNAKTPFDELVAPPGELDKRVQLLSNLFAQLITASMSADLLKSYLNVVELWSALEARLDVHK